MRPSSRLRVTLQPVGRDGHLLTQETSGVTTVSLSKPRTELDSGKLTDGTIQSLQGERMWCLLPSRLLLRDPRGGRTNKWTAVASGLYVDIARP